jgi:hypothetical protein
MKKWSWLVAPAIVIALAAMPAHAAKGGKGRNASSSDPSIVVPDAVYGDEVVATATPGGSDVYVFVQCYNPEYVYAAYFLVDAGGYATLGPLHASTWPNSAARCTASEGYFTRDGFGKWVEYASTTFNVGAA